MAGKEQGTFTREEVGEFLRLGRRIVFGKAEEVVRKLRARVDPNIQFGAALKAKYDSLVASGLSKERAFEIALEVVRDALRKAVEEDQVSQGDEAR